MADDPNESGLPGGGVGRKDRVGGSGIWPAGTKHPSNAEPRTPGGMGRKAGGGDADGEEVEDDGRE